MLGKGETGTDQTLQLVVVTVSAARLCSTLRYVHLEVYLGSMHMQGKYEADKKHGPGIFAWPDGHATFAA